MLDLKAKLLKAGLVTEQQVEKAEQEEAEAKAKRKAKRAKGKGKKGKKGKGGGGGGRDVSEAELWQKRVAKLADAPKGEQYDVIRKWVDKTRLDNPKGSLSEDADRFHFDRGEGGAISWLTLEPSISEQLKKGDAGIIAFMSHNGRAFCVVPKDVAVDVHKVRPDWLRFLSDYEFELLPLEPTGKKAKKSAPADASPAEEGAAEQADQSAEPDKAEAPPQPQPETAQEAAAGAPEDKNPQ